MNRQKQHNIKICSNGTVVFIYTDELSPLCQEGIPSINRASHVEPTSDGKWTADMSPVGGPLLGPFDLRQQALDEEVVWLNKYLFKEVKQ